MVFIYVLFSGCTVVFAQDNPFEIEEYAFVSYKLNKFEVYDTLAYNTLFEKLTQIGLKGEGKINIVHIGDSHLQADLFSGNFRKKLQTFFVGAMGGRGFVFPYQVAQTNNPANYKVLSSGLWESCRNVETTKKCTLGLSGISVSTTNANASITIGITDPTLPGYDFDRLMVFHNFDSLNFSPIIAGAKTNIPFPDKGYTLFEFEENTSTATLNFEKTDSVQNHFDLYGFNFDSNDAGIIYHSIGVNGARFDSYLGCTYFEPHLSALNPNWVIVSLGTNDAYTQAFDTIAFKKNVELLIKQIKRAAPKAAVLLTTPADQRFRKEQINKNVEIASAILKKVALKYRLSYWDFYALMGGSGSINNWYNAGLAHTDYLHFVAKGYEYQSKLMFNAFLKAYDDYVESQISNP